MSWQAYVDSSLVGTGTVDKAAIFNAEGTSVWATSAGFQVSPQELKPIVSSFSDSSEPKAIQGQGFKVAGDKYFTLRSDDRSLYGKKGKEGLVIVKTKQALLIGHYPENVQPGQAATTVEKLADYLIGVGY
ncbi:profilin, required for normal timing of actin polymerization in response to thermal stress [Knufia obscura]|uniref:Profilin n=2 Tax=Knufia TaxID=430999 RepID=A0AAN8F211_9EURO|nr:profilin, required for normal timing of actin polymerization in response to thermal stress [Knufia obscura]KAK5954883.1 profilin, required for normal timing of actin polymerization in response to thermal stress [Knufia fluminis]